MLISVDELQRLDDPLIVDTRSFKEYASGHIPGAIHLDLFAFHWFDTTSNGITNFDQQTRTLFSFVGMADHRKTVFYDNTSGMLAARGVWMAMYMSNENTAMLNGGIQAWQRAHLPIEQTGNPYRPSKFEGQTNPKLIIGFEEIRDDPNLIIIDARSRAEYTGSIIRAARGGHIPNSINIDWNLNLTQDGTLLDTSSLSKLYNISQDADIVTYCQGAYRAANSFLTLKYLGFENVRVYLGSWGEWGNRLELPVER